MAHSIDDLTTSCAEASSRNIPLQADLEKFSLLSKDDGSKLRRPVRPIDRQRMRPWLMELLDLGNVFGLRWTDRRLGIFQISWRHASRLGWNLETDGDVFERWAKHTGIYKEGDPPEPKRWKANFRCALHSLHDVIDLTVAVERRGRNACRTYRFLQSNEDKSTNRKRTSPRQTKEVPEYVQQKYLQEDVQMEIIDSCTEEEVVSHHEFKACRRDKVIVQKLDMKPEILVEDFCLHHDHDYAGPDRTHKTIFLRQGVGSIVLQKEIHSAPGSADEVESLLISNLDQLASAAMNSVGIESLQSQEVNEESACRKASEKPVVDMRELSLSTDSSIRELNVKYFSEQTHFVSDSAIYSNNFARKRKSSTVENECFAASIAESKAESGNVGNNKYSLRIFTNDGSASSPGTRQRTSSPKILFRRSKRSKVGSEKNVPDSSEPLMSSCLLLLEAATRLDNAEKTGTTSLQTGRQNLKTSPRFQCPEFSSIESEIRKDMSRLKTSTSELPKPFELQRRTRLSNCTEASKNVASFGILRTTLENTDRVTEYRGSVHTFETQPFSNNSCKPAVSSSEIKIVVKEAPFATGLFSGSRIEPKASLAFILDKQKRNKEDVLLSRVKLPAQKEKQSDGSCEPASVSGKGVSQTVPSVACNTSAGTSDTCKKPFVSSFNTHDICFSSSSGIKTYTVRSMPGSFGSLVVSPTPAVRNIKFTATSSHPTPVEVLPTYSQAEIVASSESSDLHFSGCQNFPAFETDNVMSSSCLLSESDCSSVSTESSTLIIQEKDLFTFKPGKDVVGDVAFNIEPASASSSVTHTDLPTEVTVSSEDLEDKESRRLLDAGTQELPGQTWQGYSHGQSTVLRPEFLAKVERKEELEDSCISVMKATGPLNDLCLFSGVNSETSERMKSLETEDVVCEAKPSSCKKVPLHTPAVHSYSFQPYQGRDCIRSEVISHDSSENSLHYSSNKSLQGHTSASASYETLGTSKNNDKPLYLTHSFSLSPAGTAVKVQSLAQLCKKYLANLFTALDNQASESDENDSVMNLPNVN
ncbi:unnamed protein product [Candidula unifasciata]|uniref:IRF tryptophan pentad repeat domain-containing protein n=1 Tax=Candidula unifasciata TaxID=100452 RepID=A0A8S3ZA24_9EUPU|nr:unnamed protein product [Candidula unifasciata]